MDIAGKFRYKMECFEDAALKRTNPNGERGAHGMANR